MTIYSQSYVSKLKVERQEVLDAMQYLSEDEDLEKADQVIKMVYIIWSLT